MNVDARRVELCRLDPARRLVELDDAVSFLHDRGMLTLTPCCALPSLFGACHEEPHSPGTREYGIWPKTRWWWGGAVAATDGVTVAKLHRGKNLYLSTHVADLVDPLCREEVARALDGAYGEDPRRLLAHLVDAGPATTDDIKVELGFRREAAPTGTFGARQARCDPVDGSHRRDRLRRRPPAHRRASGVGPRAHDIATVGPTARPPGAVVAAAVVLPERGARRALQWDLEAEADGVERLDDGRLTVTGALYS